MLFLYDGRLTAKLAPKDLTGELHIRDKDNYAAIIGKFQAGFCERAEVYRHDEARLSKISVKFDGNGRISMGGDNVQEDKNGATVYEGGYAGYVRHGFGIHYF